MAPTFPVFIAVVPVLLYSFVGIELPSTAAEEMVDPRRDIPVAIARAGVCQALMYAVPILAVLVVLPADSISSLHGLIDAMQTVFSVYGGAAGLVGGLSAALFVWVLLASGSAWIIGAGRAQAAACLDGAGPPVLGRIAANGVPVVIGLASGGLSLAHHGRESRRDGRRGTALLLRGADRVDRDDRAGLPVRLPGVRRAAHPPARARAPIPRRRRARRRVAHLHRRDRVVAARRRCACCGRDSAPPTRTPRCLRASKGSGCSSSCSC